MSLMLMLWLGLFGTGAVLTFRRPAWGVALYMLTFFANPPFWWWGGPVAGYRWNFYGGLLLLIAVVLHRFLVANASSAIPPLARRIGWIAAFILGNATLVHFLIAEDTAISSESYYLLAKFVLLFFMISLAIATRSDMRIALLAIVLGAGFIGYEATINERGKIIGGRLEGVGAPGARQANELASLLVTTLPLTAAFFMAGRWSEKAVVFMTAPLVLNVIILCNSRGGFLAAIMSGAVFVVAASGSVRKKALIGIGLGAFAAFMLLGDDRIIARFQTIFVSSEDRDHSAASRIDYWKAGLRMIGDFPLGAGGLGFNEVHGPRYIQQISGAEYEARSVHNGYINEACEWGIQGIALRLLFLGTTIVLLWKSIRTARYEGNEFDQLLGIALMAGIFAFLTSSVFGDFIDNEWGYWIIALAVGHAKIVHASVPLALPSDFGGPLTSDIDTSSVSVSP